MTDRPASAPAAFPSAASAPIVDERLGEAVVAALKSCYDPEIPVNIYDIGLIYAIEITPERFCRIQMTLTSPMCPVAGTLPLEVETKVAAVPGLSGAKVDVVWDPPWTPEMMSEAARLQLNLF